MADIKTYLFNGNSKDIALLNDFQPEIVVLTLAGSSGRKVIVCRNIDYTIQSGSIRFNKAPSQGTIALVPQDASSQDELVSSAGWNVEDLTQAVAANTDSIEAHNEQLEQTETDYENVSQSSIANSATISEYNEVYRAQLADIEARIAALEQRSGS